MATHHKVTAYFSPSFFPECIWFEEISEFLDLKGWWNKGKMKKNNRTLGDTVAKDESISLEGQFRSLDMYLNGENSEDRVRMLMQGHGKSFGVLLLQLSYSIMFPVTAVVAGLITSNIMWF